VQRFVLKTLFFFICLFTISSSATGFNSNGDKNSNDTDKYISSKKHYSIFHFYKHNTDFSYDPFQSPVEPEPNQNDSNDNGEKENLDNDDCNKTHFYIDSDFGFALKSTDNAFVEFQQTVLNRTTVSLVILHHSWKGFLFSIS